MSGVFTRSDRFSPKRAERYAEYPFAIHSGTREAGAADAIPAHFHEEIELIAVLKGTLSLLVSGTSLTLEAGEGILINSGRIHSFSAEKGPCEMICIMLHHSLLAPGETFAREMIEPRLSDPTAPYLKLRADRFRHREIYEKIKWMHRMERDAHAPLWVTAASAEIWANFCDSTDVPNTSARHAEEEKEAVRLMRYVRTHAAERLTLPAIAASADMGQSKCCKLFATYLGETPVEYLTRCRLEKGKALLRETADAVQDVARAAGFGGGSYFAEAFREKYGISPTEYRKKMQNK